MIIQEIAFSCVKLGGSTLTFISVFLHFPVILKSSEGLSISHIIVDRGVLSGPRKWLSDLCSSPTIVIYFSFNKPYLFDRDTAKIHWFSLCRPPIYFPRVGVPDICWSFNSSFTSSSSLKLQNTQPLCSKKTLPSARKIHNDGYYPCGAFHRGRNIRISGFPSLRLIGSPPSPLP